MTERKPFEVPRKSWLQRQIDSIVAAKLLTILCVGLLGEWWRGRDEK